MAAVDIITVEDLEPFADIAPAKAREMIIDATAIAVRSAPCLRGTTDDDVLAAAKAILRGAILRWNESGTGAYSQEQMTAGSFSMNHSMDTRQARRGMFWPSEIESLQELCRAGSTGAFAVDTAPGGGSVHVPWCNLLLGANWCSCGADIAGEPIYEKP